MKYQPIKLTAAQKLMVAMGLDDGMLFAHRGGKRESATKKGPGRKHQRGLERSTLPANKPPVGFWAGLHKATEQKLERRRLVAAFGRRQAIRLTRSTGVSA